MTPTSGDSIKLLTNTGALALACMRLLLVAVHIHKLLVLGLRGTLQCFGIILVGSCNMRVGVCVIRSCWVAKNIQLILRWWVYTFTGPTTISALPIQYTLPLERNDCGSRQLRMMLCWGNSDPCLDWDDRWALSKSCHSRHTDEAQVKTLCLHFRLLLKPIYAIWRYSVLLERIWLSGWAFIICNCICMLKMLEWSPHTHLGNFGKCIHVR